MAAHDFGFFDVIDRNAELYPDREALVMGDVRWTMAQYRERCLRMAAGLLAAGLKPGDRVAVLDQNSLEYMVIFGAAAKAGLIVVPVNWRFNPEELDYVLADTTPAVVIAGAGFVETAARGGAARRFVISGSAEGFEPLSALEADPTGVDWPQVSPSDGAVIIHTAAVSGKPRGALLSQANLVALNAIAIRQYSLIPDDCHVCTLPLFHIAGLTIALSVMHAGGKNVILEKFDPAATLAAIEVERGTVFYSFPPMLDNLVEAQAEAQSDLSSLRVINGINPPDSIERFKPIAPQVKFATLFGQTESMNIVLGWFDDDPASAGRVTDLTRLAIVDDDDNPLPMGETGEIIVRGPTVFMGYWNLADETAYTFRHGWHHTGDMGRLGESGRLYYAGRKPDKELIKPGGENVYPAEVEGVILEHDSVAEVCVIGVPDEKWGEAIKAVCVAAPGRAIDPAELTEFVAGRLARYKKPKHVVVVDALPKAEGEKTDRAQVKQDHGGLF